jgi:predicted ATPase
MLVKLNDVHNINSGTDYRLTGIIFSPRIFLEFSGRYSSRIYYSPLNKETKSEFEELWKDLTHNEKSKLLLVNN